MEEMSIIQRWMLDINGNRKAKLNRKWRDGVLSGYSFVPVKIPETVDAWEKHTKHEDIYILLYKSTFKLKVYNLYKSMFKLKAYTLLVKGLSKNECLSYSFKDLLEKLKEFSNNDSEH